MIETKPLPRELELEKQVLAFIMGNKDAMFIAGTHDLIVDNFYDSSNIMIFEEMLKLQSENISPEMPVLINRVKNVKAETITDIAMNCNIYHEQDFVNYIILLKDSYMRRQMIYLQRDINSLYNKGTDVHEVHATITNQLQTIGEVSSTELVTGDDVLNASLDMMQYKKDNPDTAKGITTGFRFLDNIIGGFKPEELIILGARTGMGKTTMVLNMCVSAMKKGHKTMFCSLEMANDVIMNKMCSSIMGIEYSFFDEALLTETQTKLVNDVCRPIIKNSVFTGKSAGLTLEKLKSIARQRKNTEGLDIIYVDYLQLIPVSDSNISKREERQQLVYISRELKKLAAELRIPVVALVQLKRGLEQQDNKEPKMSDISGSGSIEQDANKILFIHRDSYYSDTAEDVNYIAVAKNRSGGLGKVYVDFNGALSTFKQKDKEAKPVVVNNNTAPTRRYENIDNQQSML